MKGIILNYSIVIFSLVVVTSISTLVMIMIERDLYLTSYRNVLESTIHDMDSRQSGMLIFRELLNELDTSIVLKNINIETNPKVLRAKTQKKNILGSFFELDEVMVEIEAD